MAMCLPSRVPMHWAQPPLPEANLTHLSIIRVSETEHHFLVIFPYYSIIDLRDEHGNHASGIHYA